LIVLKILICGIFIIMLGCVGVGAHECGKKVLDIIKKG
jgi:hypothetical protein